MNTQQLHEIYEQRIESLMPYIRHKAWGQEDLIQEGCVVVYEMLMKDPETPNSFLRNDARSRMRSFRQRGKSLDNGKAREFVVYRYDNDDKNYENLFAEIFRNRRLPLDHQVADKVDFEKFLNSLSAAERIIVRCKLEGWLDQNVKKKLRVCWENFYALKRGIRPKIFEFYNA